MENQDILGEIFNIISFDLDTPGKNASQTRKNLYYAARTCRVFLDPAISALWRVLPSLFPLLKLLPSFQLVNNQYVRFIGYLSFCPIANSVDFRYYRTLNLKNGAFWIIMLDEFVSSSILPFAGASLLSYTFG